MIQRSQESQDWSSAKTEAEKAAVLTKLRADLDARKALGAPIMAAWKRGDIKGCEKAQRAFRRVYGEQS